MLLSPAPGAGALASHVGVAGCSAAGNCLLCLLLACCDRRCDGLVELLALGVLRGGCIPVVNDLQEEDEVERKAGDEAVKDERVVNFLECGEDAGSGAEEVVDDLKGRLVMVRTEA